MTSEERKEIAQHKLTCLLCRPDIGTPANVYRPHTGNNECWCIGTQVFLRCAIDRKYWEDLPRVTYI